MVGAIGELLGAVGVIATLGYLAVQVRSNTIAIRRDAGQEAFDAVRAQLRQLSADPDLARIWRTGLEGMEGLDADEQLRFAAYLLEITYYWLRVYSLAQDGTVDADLLSAVAKARADIVAAPGYQQWYETRKHWLPDGFRQVLEQVMGSNSGVYLRPGAERQDAARPTSDDGQATPPEAV